ncbi:hypothetical protein [Methylobacterium oryzisoli]|uniref:hypothetical protein n=1 Tax=Methylobacterium oryzisoli TaxID=3385502 RepID=UPI00389274E1
MRNTPDEEINLLDHLVIEGEARRIVQAQLVEYLRGDGHSAHAARRLLHDIDDVLATMQRYRADLRASRRS